MPPRHDADFAISRAMMPSLPHALSLRVRADAPHTRMFMRSTARERYALLLFTQKAIIFAIHHAADIIYDEFTLLSHADIELILILP